MRVKKILSGMIVAAIAATAMAASAQEVKDPYREPALSALKDKKIAYLPISLGFDMAQAWGGVTKLMAQRYGMKFSTQDPNWSTDAMAQAFTSLIAEHPDVIVTQNPDIQSLARLLKQANAAGIFVIQVNMQGAFQTDAFVGPDFIAIGEQEANTIVKACGKDSGKSGKIAIVQGVLTGGVSFYQVQGITQVLSKHPDIHVVSSQAADWDASKARSITETVLQQNPNLCAIIDVWDGQARGTGAAIQQAGKQGQVMLVTSGGGAQSECDALSDGTFSVAINYDGVGMGRDIASAIMMLLQSKQSPGAIKFQMYSPTRVMTKEDVKQGTCWNPDIYANLLK
jgi:ribose transport system substrate-binding protein